MKKTLLFFLVSVSISCFGQDTTSYRMIAGGFNDLQFYKSDSSFMNSNSITGVVHVLFTNPKDSLLYGIVDELGSSGNRNLYTIDPFSGAKSLVADLTITYTNSGDLGEGDVLYLISGQGDGNPGVVTAVDMITFNETTLFTSATSTSSNPTSTEYNPTDSSLYIFESFGEVLYVYDLATATESPAIPFTYITSENTEHHGAFYDEANDVFHFGSYGGDIYSSNSAPYTTLDMYYFDDYNYNNSLDLCYLDYTLRADTSYFSGFCPREDSVMISLVYDVSDFSWYRNGVLLSGMTNDTIWVSESGNYQALMQIGTTGNYMWSESIVLNLFTVPVVNITSSGDSLLCSNETDLTLIGATAGGGSVQWYESGVPILGETGQTLVVNQAGWYNQLKTNMSGCSDSSVVGYQVFVDNTPMSVSISQAMSDSLICPQDTIVLQGVSSGGTLQWLLDGVSLTGETGASLNATSAGEYDLVMTLASGCTETTANPYTIYLDPNCSVGIEENSFNLSIYPNPVEDLLTITADENILEMQLLDLNGKMIYSQLNIGANLISIDMSSLSDGVYLVKIQFEEKIVTTRILK